MAKLGLKGFSMGIDKGWDMIPDKYFHPDTYRPIKNQKNKKDSEHRDKRYDRQRRSRRNSDPGRGEAIRTGVAAAGGLAGAAAQQNGDDRHDRRDDRGRRQSRLSRDDSESDGYEHHHLQERDQPGYSQQQQQHQAGFVSQGPDPQNHPEQGWISQDYYQPTGSEHNPSLQQASSVTQGDPNFPYTAQHLNPPNTQPLYTPAYNPYASNPYIPSSPIQAFTQTVQPPPMGDNHQQAPPYSGSAQRYTPANYQPRDYQNGGGAGYDDRMTSSRYNQSDQNLSGGGRGGRNDSDRYSDDDRDYDRPPRRDRSRSKHRKHKSREQSPGGNPLHNAMHNHLDNSEKGMASGAIGAVAGGLIGHKFGKGPIATVAGVLIGGIGANAWEAREAKSKEKKQIREKEKKSSRRAKSSSGRGEAYSSRDSYDDRRGGGDGYDSAEDASDDSYAQRRPARREKEGRRDSRRKPTPRHEDDGDEGEDPIELGNTRPTGIGI